MKRYRFLHVFLLVFILCCPTIIFAQDEHDLRSVQTEGRSIVIGNNFAHAQRLAIQDALRMAVEKSTAQWLSPDIIARKASILKEKIYSDADAYIQTYKILSELPSQKVYTVNLIAKVDQTALKEALQALGMTIAAGAAQTATLSLTVRGVRSYPDYTRFVNVLRNSVGGVKNVHIRQAQQGSIRLNLTMEGTLRDLVDKLGKTGRFSFHLNQISEKELEITLLD
jgi:hypothetical protein